MRWCCFCWSCSLYRISTLRSFGPSRSWLSVRHGPSWLPFACGGLRHGIRSCADCVWFGGFVFPKVVVAVFPGSVGLALGVWRQRTLRPLWLVIPNAAGFVLGILPVAIWIACHGMFQSFWTWVVVGNGGLFDSPFNADLLDSAFANRLFSTCFAGRPLASGDPVASPSAGVVTHERHLGRRLLAWCVPVIARFRTSSSKLALPLSGGHDTGGSLRNRVHYQAPGVGTAHGICSLPRSVWCSC